MKQASTPEEAHFERCPEMLIGTWVSFHNEDPTFTVEGDPESRPRKLDGKLSVNGQVESLRVDGPPDTVSLELSDVNFRLNGSLNTTDKLDDRHFDRLTMDLGSKELSELGFTTAEPASPTRK